MVWKSWYRPLRNWIRSAWFAQDERTKRWLLYPLLDVEMYVSEGRAPWLSTICFLETPIDVQLASPRPFEQAVTYLRNSAKRTRHCKNRQCPAPYFLPTDEIKNTAQKSARCLNRERSSVAGGNRTERSDGKIERREKAKRRATKEFLSGMSGLESQAQQIEA
jgi:hypothetical protein